MTRSSSNIELDRSDQSASDIDLAATVNLQPEYFSQSHQIVFSPGADDLDSLIFSHVNLPSGCTITLLRHLNAPYEGVELYLPPGLSSPSSILSEAMTLLNISLDDLSWVHPQITLSNVV